jgi:hypothetical protein
VRHPRSAAACPEIARIRTVRDQSALLDFQHGIYPVKSARIERNAGVARHATIGAPKNHSEEKVT